MTITIPGFRYDRVPVADGVALHTAIGGAGPAVVLLHGFPQTHLMWRHVAAELAADHTVICPDLRGYGGSGKPAEDGPATYAKRTMAADIVALAAALGHNRFALAAIIRSGSPGGWAMRYRCQATAASAPCRMSHMSTVVRTSSTARWLTWPG